MLALEKLRLQIAEFFAHTKASESKGCWPVLWGIPPSRRDVIHIGMTAVAFARAKSSAKHGPLCLEAHSNESSLDLPCEASWVVDPSHFDSTARVRWTTDDGAFRVGLSGAWLPGSGIACDFVFRARRERGSWFGRYDFPSWEAGAKARLSSGRRASRTIRNVSRSKLGFRRLTH
jgi:hypothetical protein